MDSHRDPNGSNFLRVEGSELVCAVAVSPGGPRVALGFQAGNFDNLALALAAIAKQAKKQHGYDPAELLRRARDAGLNSVEHVSAGGLILPDVS